MSLSSWLVLGKFAARHWKPISTVLLVCIVAAACYLRGCIVRPKPAIVLRGVVTAVPDGNHIVVRVRVRRRLCRLSDIAVPAVDTPWGRRARRLLLDTVLNTRVSITLTEGDKLTKHITGIVYSTGHDTVNVLLLEQGLARCLNCSDKRWKAVEAEAKRNGRGMWGDEELPQVLCWPPDVPEVDSDWAEPIEVSE